MFVEVEATLQKKKDGATKKAWLNLYNEPLLSKNKLGQEMCLCVFELEKKHVGETAGQVAGWTKWRRSRRSILGELMVSQEIW